MNLLDFFKKTKLDSTFLIGYYGGTNYGDELLLETLQLMFDDIKANGVRVYYSNPRIYSTYHQDFGNEIIDSRNRTAVLKAILKSKNIAIGGGGIWGLDANVNIFLLSLLLFISSIALRKNVYLLGVGYYGSTTKLGHFSAVLAAWSARKIFARDKETYHRFKKFNSKTTLDTDISFYLPSYDLKRYEKEAAEIAKELRFNEPRTIFALRRFSQRHKNSFNETILSLCRGYSRGKALLMLFESQDISPEEYDEIKKVENANKDVLASDFSFNPLAFFLAMKMHAKNLVMIAPQYHAQISAHLAGMEFMPIEYDRKNKEFFNSIKLANTIGIKNVTADSIKKFLKIDA